MRLELPLWALLLFSFASFVVSHWIFTVPAGIGLAVLGWRGAPWLGSFRWLAFGASALLAMPFVLAAFFAVRDEINAATARAKYLRTLERDETVTGLPLYAGTRIWFADEAHTTIRSVELPRLTTILEVPFTGTVVWSETVETWAGMLDADHSIGGWPCRRGWIEIGRDGTLRRCELASAHRFFDYELPADTKVSLLAANNAWNFSIPQDKGLAIKALSATAPGGISLQVSGEGRLKAIHSGTGQTIVVHGVRLNSMNVRFSEQAAFGEAAEPFVVAGEQQPAGTAVKIDLLDGTVSLAGPKWWLSE
ncbi:MAG: hypothetical protein HY852_00150 [Bradyrhizobium sp.]|uniref:hypothetical protein n=1 Tax=Bradyrhizobium sp. TaxID=376 RepID=UPI0025B92EF4|nr:hypothetical protein [Bradyrhizobium sp.]MBI5260213.1 hypothetical protein [Bradyrhizobium sp.]